VQLYGCGISSIEGFLVISKLLINSLLACDDYVFHDVNKNKFFQHNVFTYFLIVPW